MWDSSGLDYVTILEGWSKQKTEKSQYVSLHLYVRMYEHVCLLNLENEGTTENAHIFSSYCSRTIIFTITLILQLE